MNNDAPSWQPGRSFTPSLPGAPAVAVAASSTNLNPIVNPYAASYHPSQNPSSFQPGYKGVSSTSTNPLSPNNTMPTIGLSAHAKAVVYNGGGVDAMYSEPRLDQAGDVPLLANDEPVAAITALPLSFARSTLQSVGVFGGLQAHFRQLDIEAAQQVEPDSDLYRELPLRYHSAMLLDSSAQRSAGGAYGYPSKLFKVMDRVDNKLCTLKRFDNVRTMASILKSVQSKWAAVTHPGIVPLTNIFLDKGALFFVHHYHPSAQTLQDRIVSAQGQQLSEPFMWRVLIQLLAAIRAVHKRGLAVRVLSPAHVLVTSGAVIRISNTGIADVIEFESRKTIHELQLEDLLRLGQVVLSIGLRTNISSKNVDQAIQHFQRSFSPDLHHVVSTLITGKSTVSQVTYLVSEHIQDELDACGAAVDSFHDNLRNEYNNGRLLRLLLKICAVGERPDSQRAPRWSETGDRYVLKLFYDYVFHQSNDDGSPNLDMGHVIQSLNKLDAGDSETMLLSSRDKKDLFVVSFNDIRRCLEASFSELQDQAVGQVMGRY